MTDGLKISQRPAVTPPMTGAETLALISGGADRRVAVQDLLSSVYYSQYFTDLDAAIAAIGATNATLVVNTAFTVTNNCTIPTTLALHFLRGGSLNVPTAKTVTINGPKTGALSKHFNLTGTGVVNFGAFAIEQFAPECWGAVGDSDTNGLNGTDSTAGLQACFTAAGVTAALTNVYSTQVKLQPGARYRTLPVTLPAGVSLDMEDAVLHLGVNLAGYSFASVLLTINATTTCCWYKGLSASCLWFGAGHLFNPAYWESNIGIRFNGALDIDATFGDVSGWCIGAQWYTAGGIVSYSRFCAGNFGTNKVNIDIRAASVNFANECFWHDINVTSSSNMNAYGTLAGIRLSCDDDGLHGQNNNRWDGFCFQMGNHSASFDWVSGTSKSQYSCYATSEKYWSFLSATANCGTDAPPASDTVTFTNSGGDLLGTFANYSLQDGMVVFLTNSGGNSGAPTGLSLYTWYWVVGSGVKTFKLAGTKGGTPIVYTDAGTGTHSIEAQRYTKYTDNAGKTWQCDGVKSRAPFMVDDTSCNTSKVSNARWETGYGPFTHLQTNRRFATQFVGNVFEPYSLTPPNGSGSYATYGELNAPSAIDVTKYQLDNQIKTYNTSVAKVFQIDNLARGYIKSVTGHATIAGFGFNTRGAWDTIVQANATGNNCILCKDSLLVSFGSNWAPVVFVDMINNKRFKVTGDLIANAQLLIAKGFDANFKNLDLNNFTKSICGGSRLITSSGGLLDFIANSNVQYYGVPNIAGSTTRYVMIGLNGGNIRGLMFSVPEGENSLDAPVRVCTPWGASNDLSRSAQGEPVVGWFQRAGEIINNINSGPSDPQGWVVKTAGALAPAWATSTAVIIGELRVSDSGTKVYAAVAAGTTGATPPTGTGTGISDGTVSWDYQCPVAALEVIPRPAKSVTINVAGPATLSTGDMTGAAFVSLLSTNNSPGSLTTKTGTQLVADHGGGASGSYTVRITNAGSGTLTLLAGSGVTFGSGTYTVLTNTYRDFLVTINSASAVTIQTIGTGTYS